MPHEQRTTLALSLGRATYFHASAASAAAAHLKRWEGLVLPSRRKRFFDALHGGA